MRSEPCGICEVTLSGEDIDELVTVSLEHFTKDHPQLGLTQTAIRNYYEAAERLTGPRERLPAIGDIEIRESGEELLEDVLAFFDHDAFVDRPEWSSCYCMNHHRPEGERDCTWRQNRDGLAARIRQGTTTGVLAYVDGRLGGWCNASLRSEFPELVGVDELPDDEVGAIWCFVIAPPYRRHGLATRLLDAACASLRRRGVRTVQGYPRPAGNAPPGWEDADAFGGPMDLYLRAGFEHVGETGRSVVVQKTL